MTTRLGILGTPESWYVKDLQRAATESLYALDVSVHRFADLKIGLMESGLAWQSDLDALLVRSMPLGSLEQVIFRMDALQALQESEVRVINPPRTLEVAIDKWLTLQRLHRTGVPVPNTMVCQSRESALEAYSLLGGDVLVKPLFGGEGRGIIRVQSPEMAWRVFGGLQQMGQVIYVQQFVEHFGYDVRVLFVGPQRFAIRRRAQGSWLTNLSRGSIGEAHQLTEEELRLAILSKETIGGSVLGVDLLPAKDGRLFVLEVNAVPGWRGTAKALGIDIAKEVVDHACKLGEE